MKLTKPFITWGLTSLGILLDTMIEENKRTIVLKYKGKRWQIKKL